MVVGFVSGVSLAFILHGGGALVGGG